MPGEKPNIIYILADDMGYGDMGCNNPESKIPTPHLDRLAAQGMRFTDAHASSSVCSPSRYALLTGRYCWRTPLKSSVLWPWDPPLIEPGRLTAATLLRQQGYRTACIGKWHLGWEWATRDGRSACGDVPIGQHDREQRLALERNIDYNQPIGGGPLACGFDHYFGVDVPNFPPYTWFEQDRLAAAPAAQKPEEMFGLPGAMKPGWKLEEMVPEFVRRARDYIAAAGSDPFFLYLPLTSPHTPIIPNEAFIGRSGTGLYGDFVCEVDWVVGEVMAALDEQGLADDTLLIFTSDNGPECIPAAAGGCYEHARLFGHYSMAHLRGAKRDTWEGGHRVPFVARWPGVTPAGSVCGQLSLLGDFTATCAELTGVRLPPPRGGGQHQHAAPAAGPDRRAGAPLRRVSQLFGGLRPARGRLGLHQRPFRRRQRRAGLVQGGAGVQGPRFPRGAVQSRGGHLRAAEPVRPAPGDRAPAVGPPRGHQSRGGGRGRSAGRGARGVGVADGLRFFYKTGFQFLICKEYAS